MSNKTFFNRIIAVILLLCMTTLELGAVPTEAYRSYIRGLFAVKAGDMESAMQEYQRVTTLDRNAGSVYKDLAYLYWQSGRVQEAFEAAEELDKANGDVLATQLFLGSFYLLAGQAGKARTAWEKALKIDPGNEVAILYLAAYHSSDNDPEKAITYWNKYLEREPTSAEGYYQLGVAQEKLGQLEKAKQSFLKTISLKPESAEGHIALAQVYEKEEKYVAAAQEYERYLEIVPDNMTVLLYLGGLYYRLKNYPASENIFQRAQKLSPKDTTILFWLGVIAEEKKDWDGAIRFFESISSKDDNPALLTRLSYYYSAKKDYPTAVKYLKRVVKLDPQNPTSFYLLGLAYFDIKKFRHAEHYMRKAVEMKPDFAEVYFHLGVLYDQWGKFNKAVPELEHALQLDPRNDHALNYLGYSYADRNVKLDEAERLIKQALDVDPENGSYMDSLGWVHFKMGRLDEAEKELLTATAMYSDAVIWEHLGDVRMKMNRTPDAWDAYQKAQERAPKNRQVEDKIQQLEKLVLPRTIQRKVLKHAEGNLRLLSSLRTSFTMAGISPATFRMVGVFQYARPDRWRVDVLGNFLAPQIVIIQNKGLNVYPRSLESQVPQETWHLFDRVQQYLNTDLLADFDNDKTETKRKGSSYYYKNGGRELTIDRKTGTITEYRLEKKVLLRFKKYEQVEGLYVPTEIEIYSNPDNFSARVHLQNSIINKTIEDKAFTLPQQ